MFYVYQPPYRNSVALPPSMAIKPPRVTGTLSLAFTMEPGTALAGRIFPNPPRRQRRSPPEAVLQRNAGD